MSSGDAHGIVYEDANGGVYLDAAATAPLKPEALAAMVGVLERGQANPSSVHSRGYQAAAALRESREQIASAMQARNSEVVFTSGGTEANNLAVIGLALANPRGRHLVTSPIEHPSVIESCRYLERVFGFEITELPVDAQGLVAPSSVAGALRPDTTLVSVGLANGEIGTVQQIGEITAVTHAVGALLHTDAVQAAASLPVSFSPDAWPGPADAMTIASHKFGGPQGAGALLLRSGTRIEPLLHGGGQELGRRSGTENVAAVAGFAAAVTSGAEQPGTRALALAKSRDELVRRLLEGVQESQLTGHPSERLPGHASFVVRGISGESLLVALDVAGISASSGSACAAGKDEPSAALLALGLTPELAQTAIRFTLTEPLASGQIETIVRIIGAEVRSARSGG